MSSTKPTILLTGANGGLGIGCVQNILASKYAETHHAIYTVRSLDSAGTLRSLLDAKAQKGHSYEVLALDLGDLKEVREVASSLNARIKSHTLAPITGLLLNAAMQDANSSTLTPQIFTPDTHEAAFQINYLSPFLLVLLLLGSMHPTGRIVLVSSYMHNALDPRPQQMGIYDLTKKSGRDYTVMFESVEAWRRGVSYEDDAYKAGMRRYGASKLGGVMFMYELQSRLLSDPKLSGVEICCLDPGAMANTALMRNSPPVMRVAIGILGRVLGPVFTAVSPNGTFRTPYKSGSDLLKTGLEREGAYKGGVAAVYWDGGRKGETSLESRDGEKQKLLWRGSLEIVGLKEGETVLKDWR